MPRDSVWTNKDGLTVGFGTRTVTTHGSYSLDDREPFQRLIYRFRGEDLASAVDVDGDEIRYAPVIPNGATIVDATLEVVEPFNSASNTATLSLGLYDKDGSAVDTTGIDATIAQTAIDAIGDTIACDGGDVGTVVATTGGVKVSGIYGTEAFTAGEGVLIVRFITELT